MKGHAEVWFDRYQRCRRAYICQSHAVGPRGGSATMEQCVLASTMEDDDTATDSLGLPVTGKNRFCACLLLPSVADGPAVLRRLPSRRRLWEQLMAAVGASDILDGVASR